MEPGLDSLKCLASGPWGWAASCRRTEGHSHGDCRNRCQEPAGLSQPSCHNPSTSSRLKPCVHSSKQQGGMSPVCPLTLLLLTPYGHLGTEGWEARGPIPPWAVSLLVTVGRISSLFAGGFVTPRSPCLTTEGSVKAACGCSVSPRPTTASPEQWFWLILSACTKCTLFTPWR